MVQSGDIFTIVGTSENTVYFWGSRIVLLQPQLKNNDLSTASAKLPLDRRRSSGSVSVISETSLSEVIKIGNHFVYYFLVFYYRDPLCRCSNN